MNSALRKAVVKPQSAPVEIADYPEIDDHMVLVSAAFDSLERARQSLKEAEKASKDATEDLCSQIRRKESSLGDERKQSLLSHVYWSDRRFAGSVKKLCGYCFKPDPAVFEFICKRCGNQSEAVAATWTDADRYRTGDLGMGVCAECRQREEQKRTKHFERLHAMDQIHQQNVAALRNMCYADYLMTDHWRQVRGYALYRAGRACHLCASTDNLNVHHRTYERLGCEAPEDLTVLCRDCHAKFHDRYPSEPPQETSPRSEPPNPKPVEPISQSSNPPLPDESDGLPEATAAALALGLRDFVERARIEAEGGGK